MKRFTMLIGAALAALFISGCAKDQAAAQTASAAAPPQDPKTAYAAAIAECAGSIERIATAPGGDPGSRVAAVGAIERLCGAQGGVQLAAFNQAPAAQPGLGQVLLTTALQVGDLFIRGYGLKLTRDIGVVQSNNQASTAIASYGAFSTMGSQIRDAGIAGYPFIQAPGTVTTTTTTNTLSGTGVLGSGSYTGPVNRTCTGGAAGNGAGTTTGAPGGASGPVSC